MGTHYVATALKKATEAYREAEEVANLEGEEEGKEEDQKTGGMLIRPSIIPPVGQL